MKIVYISGAIVGSANQGNVNDVAEKNIELAREYANALASKKVGVFCTHIYELDPDFKDITERQRYFYDLNTEFLINSQAVVFLPNWKDSFGARQEEKIADELGLPKFYPKSPDDTAEIEEWYLKNNNTNEDKKAVDWDKIIEIRRAMAKYVFAKAA